MVSLPSRCESVLFFRALKQNVAAGRIVSGGSTLTMQVARILYPTQRTLAGKMKQIFRAFQLEAHLSKNEILTLYLNYAPFGSNIEGVQTASFTWLGKKADQLSHAQAALLAVLPQAPSFTGRTVILSGPELPGTKCLTGWPNSGYGPPNRLKRPNRRK